MELPHRLSLDERRKLTVTGVTEVVSFEETGVMLRTQLGDLVIQGEGMKLKNMTGEEGQVTVEGSIGLLAYQEAAAPGGWLRRLFR